MKEKERMYVVVDTRQIVGNSVLFWAHKRKGYTCDLRMAGLFDYEEAKSIEEGRSTDKMYPLSEVLKLVQHHVDCQDLYSAEKKGFPHTYSYLKEYDGG